MIREEQNNLNPDRDKELSKVKLDFNALIS